MMIGAVMAGEKDYLSEMLDIDKMRAFCLFDDDSAKMLISAYIANLLYGTRYVAKKKLMVNLAKKMASDGIKKEQILKLLKISPRTYFRIKRELKK